MAYLCVILLLSYVTSSSAQGCFLCSCFDVKPQKYSVLDFVPKGPYYVLSIAPARTYDDLDSICYDFSEIKEVSNTTFVQVKYTSKDMEETPLVYIESDIMPGTFSGLGPTYPEYKGLSAGAFSYKDFVLQETCPNLYVIYRCELIGRQMPGCPAMRSMATVMIISANRTIEQGCVSYGKDFAQYIADFRDSKFYDLPNKATDPCPKPPAMSPMGADSDTHILKIKGLLSI